MNALAPKLAPSPDAAANNLFVVDFGSQYSMLIARRLREIGVHSLLTTPGRMLAECQQKKPAGIILSGGPATVGPEHAQLVADLIKQTRNPVLGICYGMHALGAALGGRVESLDHREFGSTQVELDPSSQLFSDLARPSLEAWMSHGDQMTELPQGFSVTGRSKTSPIAAMACEERKLYGLQFHPEVAHTEQGRDILQRFALDVCGLEARWTTDNIIEDSIAQIKRQVGSERVLLALSGGVDSAVTAALLERALPGQVVAVHIDNGLMRTDESRILVAAMKKALNLEVRLVDAADDFLQQLEGVTDPEEKRKIVGRVFIEHFAREAQALDGIRWLAQGTIYPDRIESAAAGEASALIKSHHNVGGLPENMPLKVIEPLQDLFKDEVRKIGLALGLSPQLIRRHPFPGPGLAVRVLGPIDRRTLGILRRADDIFLDELRRNDYYDKVSQAFAVFLPVRSVGVTGDYRNYGSVIALRAVVTDDFMTARCSPLPPELLAQAARRITNELSEVARVVYDLSDKPPGTIEWE